MSTIKQSNRQILAHKYDLTFMRVIQSIQFRTWTQNWGLNMYKFEKLSNKYREEVIGLCSIRLSNQSGNIPSMITNVSAKETKVRFINEIDHAIKTGLSFVAIHSTTSKVAFIFVVFDMLDAPETQTKKYSIGMRKRGEFLTEIFDNNSIYKTLDERKRNNDINYGEVIYSAFACNNAHLKSKNISLLATICTMLHYLILCGIDSVKQETATAVHPKFLWIQKAMTIMLKSAKINVSAKSFQFKINDLLINKIELDPWYKGIDGALLNEIIQKDYSVGCGTVFFDRDRGVDLTKILGKLSLMDNIITMSKMKTKQIVVVSKL